MSASKPARRDAMLIGLLSIVALPTVAQSEALEQFSDSMIDIFLVSDDAEIEAASYHDLLGTLDEEVERGSSPIKTDSVNSEERTGVKRALILESEQ